MPRGGDCPLYVWVALGLGFGFASSQHCFIVSKGYQLSKEFLLPLLCSASTSFAVMGGQVGEERWVHDYVALLS